MLKSSEKIEKEVDMQINSNISENDSNVNEHKLFLGCVIPARLPFIEGSAKKVFQKLKIPMTNIENASCCPDPTGISAVDQTTWLTLGARNLTLVDNKKNDIISLCSGCVETLKMVDHILAKEPEKKEEVNSNLAKIDRKLEGRVDVKHAAQVLYENLELIKSKITHPLKGLKVAVHYGCHFLSPSDVIQWDDPFEPTTVDEIINTLGAESVDYDRKLQCCGNPLLKTDKDLSYELLYQKLLEMKKAGVHVITVVCPSCFLQFDYQQKAVNKIYGTDFKIPVLYLTELVALALGFSDKEISLKFHGIKPKKILEELNLIENQ
ncbi:MAG: CoB--CoM heterodisulfide reductase iron-sulfur subunit B family protein [Candidatus Lokiarchaeota archaeon]|nr:CoB--CoM heterodisulfide reductase iron-sulfur subunit B family protein [Candidatus Harpocratesius repetitus]